MGTPQDDHFECAICFEPERPDSYISKPCTPSQMSPNGMRKCNHEVCEACSLNMYLNNIDYCPFCHADWSPYFSNMAYRVRTFTDCLVELLFHDFLDKDNVYHEKVQYMLEKHGRPYCLAILCNDFKRLACS